MFTRYVKRVVSEAELDEHINRAKDNKKEFGFYATVLVAEELELEGDTDVDYFICDLLDDLCAPSFDDRRTQPNVDMYDVLSLIDERGWKLGTIYVSPSRDEQVVDLDDEVWTDAHAWTTFCELPQHVQERVAKFILARAADTRLHDRDEAGGCPKPENLPTRASSIDTAVAALVAKTNNQMLDQQEQSDTGQACSAGGLIRLSLISGPRRCTTRLMLI